MGIEMVGLMYRAPYEMQIKVWEETKKKKILGGKRKWEEEKGWEGPPWEDKMTKKKRRD